MCEIPISFVQAALGDTIKIPVLGEGGERELKIPGGTQPDEILSLPGEGMPTLRRNKRGDLFVKIAVKIPKKLNQRQRELLNAFAETERSKTPKKVKNLWHKMKK